MKYLILILKRSLIMVIILQIIFYINGFFITGDIDQTHFFISKEHLWFTFKMWIALFIIFLLIYSVKEH